MKILRGINDPFGGEHVLATTPSLGPYARAVAHEPAIRKRLNFFPQRSLTHIALIEEQRSRIADAMRLGQAVAPGVIDGLELGIEGNMLVLLPGHAIAPDGQDMELAYPQRVPFDAVSIVSPRVEALLETQHTSTVWQRLSNLQRQATLAQVMTDFNGASFLPHAMVLVAVPRTIALDRSDALASPCPNATGEGALSRAAWEDGFQLAWVPWPEGRSLPLWSTGDGADAKPAVDSRFRNRLAYAVFNAERERLSLGVSRSMRERNDRAKLTSEQLDALAAKEAEIMQRARPWPWEEIGVALSIVAFDADFKPAFADRGAVVRQGGGRRNRSALVPWSGDDVLWQARVSQLLEHLAELPPDQRNAQVLQQQFDWLPPAGVLPRDVVDLLGARQAFFPPQFDVQAQPIPIDMVDALIAESSSTMPFNLSLRDQVQLLVPVPARYFDPDLLKLDERIHPLFDMEIGRLSRERMQLLTHRDALRRRSDILTQAVTGDLQAYAQDDPNGLPDETGALDAMAFNRVHVSTAAAGGAELHKFIGAHLKLQFQAVDELIVFVRIDSAPVGIGVSPLISDDTLAAGEQAPATRPFVWGTAPAVANGDRVGDLPATGVWTRLSVPMARAGIAGKKIDGLAFEIFGGGGAASQVSWGYTGKAANGIESYWLTDALPPGATAGSAVSWNWVSQGDAFDAASDTGFGIPVEAATTGAAARPHMRHVSELEKLLDNWKAFRDGILTAELGEPAKGPRTKDTPPRVVDGGLDELIARLDGRIKAAGDHVDFGFLRARTDIFRLRQSVLGVDDAGRFLTSPAAAELVRRNENPVATEKEFADYFKRLGEKTVQSPVFASPPLTSAPAPASRVGPTISAASSRLSAAAGMNTLSTSNTTLFTSAAPRVSAEAMASRVGVGIISDRLAPIERVAKPISIAAPRPAVSIIAAPRPVQLSVEAPPAIKDVVGASLIGATYNTVTVAERFSLPASVVSSNSAAKGKNDFVRTGLIGLKGSGLIVDDLPVFGYKKGTDANVSADLLLTDTAVVDSDATDIDARVDLHEAVYFRRGIDAIDNTIRFLRGMELRAEDYRRLQADAKSVRERMLGVIANIGAMLNATALKLAEVRHDLSVARALRAEEQARIDALIARRKAILSEQVPYLVFRRPRFTLTLQDVPVIAAQPADVSDPVPKCRSEAHDSPPELAAMVETLRDVPVRWLRLMAQAFVKLDRIIDIERVVSAAQQRMLVHAVSAPEVLEGRESATGMMLADTFGRHTERVAKTRGAAIEKLAAFDARSWKQSIEPAQHIVSIRDVLQAGVTQREVTLAASGLLDDIAGVAACLHASFCTVAPATRLRWAELFSQLDAAVSLRQLTVLPGFGDEKLGVDFIVWRQMQRMVDWLFAQVTDEADAQDAINDLVRVCLLLASHAPVKRIISARIKRPMPAVIDTRIEIELDPRLTRIGMQVLVHAPVTQALVARAVIEDLASGVASARITHATAGPTVMLDSSMRVQVQAGPALSTPAVQRAEAARVQADANPVRGAASQSAKTGEQAAQQRVAKQVEALRDSGGRAGRMR